MYCIIMFLLLQHDSGPECAPYGTGNSASSGGNYIMFASATMGDKSNNNKFSPCSKDNITYVIQAVLTSGSKENCFKSKCAIVLYCKL